MNKIEETDIQSQTISWLRFPLSVLVIIIHNFQFPKEVNLLAIDFLNFSGMDFYNIFRTFTSQFAGICNPLFL